MTTVALTGAEGFLGWHVRVLASALGLDVRVLTREALADASTAESVLDGCDRVLHLAGVNRASDEDISEGNVGAAEQLARALVQCDRPPVVAFANSTQVGNGTAYGTAKERAADVLLAACDTAGTTFVDVRLPNLFGEHGRPFYNSVVATFAHLLAQGGAPEIHQDRPVDLLYVGEAADVLLNGKGSVSPMGRTLTVSQVADRLGEMAAVYGRAEIPPLSDRFSVDLFNTYRSFCAPARPAPSLPRHEDQRGALVEAVKAHGGTGQTFFSSSVPGVTRGQHYHLRKVERFVVVEGHAQIRLRRKFTDEVVTYDVTGDQPVAVDMPTMWIHNITNTGSSPLLTLFWTNDIFDPSCPDTYAEEV